jgi:hypothetical protein
MVTERLPEVRRLDAFRREDGNHPAQAALADLLERQRRERVAQREAARVSKPACGSEARILARRVAQVDQVFKRRDVRDLACHTASMAGSQDNRARGQNVVACVAPLPWTDCPAGACSSSS